MKIALTGASGTVGRGIADMALEQGHSLVLIDRVAPRLDAGDRVQTVACDASDYDALVSSFAGCDAVIHMAAIPSPGRDPDHVIHNNNVVGSYNALRAAVENGIMRICQASSVNAIGHSYSRQPRYDYFPIDEQHADYNEEPYSLSKSICELQGDSFARRYEDISIASMRFHFVTPDVSNALAIFEGSKANPANHLWAWTHLDAAADACLRAVEGRFSGHEVFYIVSPTTFLSTPSAELARENFPDIPLKTPLEGSASFFNSSKAERVLDWNHDKAIRG